MSFKYEYLKHEEPTFLMKAQKSGYVCPCCQNGCSGHHGNGLAKDPNNDRWKCFKCGFYGSTIDLWIMDRGYNDMMEACRDLETYFGTQSFDLYTPPKHITPVSQIGAIPNYTAFYEEAHKHIDYSYLEKRGISKETQDYFNIGFVKDWRPQKAKNAPPVAKCIIPRSASCYLARSTSPNANPAYAKQVEGRFLYPFNHQAFNDPSVRNIFITEGEIDAMSVKECCPVGADVVGLCSIANTRKFMEQANKDKQYILFLDNDQAGTEAQGKLYQEMRKKGFKVIGVKYPKNIEVKDPNDMLLRSRTGMERYLKSAAAMADRMLDKRDNFSR